MGNNGNDDPNLIRGRFNSLPQEPQTATGGRGQVPDAAKHSRTTANAPAALPANLKATAATEDQEKEEPQAVDTTVVNHAPRRSLIAAPPQEGIENLKRWGQLAGGIVSSPLRWLFDNSTEAEEEEWDSDEPPLSPGRRFALILGGIIAWLWSAIISQDVMNNLFPFVREASATNKSELFKDGMTLQWKAILASLVFCLMLSLVELIILRRKHKSRARRVVLYLAITVDIVFNAVGYASFMGHSRYFEWNPLAPFLFQNKPVEWGSAVIEVAALINALLPEILWSEASRKRKVRLPNQREQGQNQKEPGRGQLVLTPQGWKWFSEEELKQATRRQKKVAAQINRGGRK